MSNTTLSPNMSLVVPTVGVDPGPDWANNLNADLSILDGHNHAAGSGVQINPAGLNINSDLTFLSNNAIALRSSRYTSQASPISGALDLDCVYVSGVDLYYNDGNGNQIRITESGGVAGTPGSIANLTSPASATYVSGDQTFVWQSAALTPANMDFGSAIFRNITASSFGVTLNPPSSLGSNYSLTLPAVPGVKSIMALDASGNMSAPYTVDGTTIEIVSNIIQVNPAGYIVPTVQRFLSGSGTYTVPTSPRKPIYLRVTMAGGGEGGGTGNSAYGNAGSNTTWNSTDVIAGGATGGGGGTVSLSTNTLILSAAGGTGTYPTVPGSTALVGGGQGGSNPLGGSGGGGPYESTSGAGGAGSNASANTGAGGGGAGGSGTGGGLYSGGGGGAAGGYVEFIVSSPGTSYSYSVGAGGTGTTGAGNGGNGAAGVVIVEEFYQ